MSLLLLMSCECIWVHLCLLEPLFGEEFVDTRSVFGAADLWLERHIMLFPLNSIPIDLIEECVLLDILCVSNGPDTLCGVFGEQLLKKATGFVAEVGLHWYWLFGYVSQHLLAVPVVVGWPSAKHFVKEGTQTPPISSPGMT